VGSFAVGRPAEPGPGTAVVRPVNDADWPDRARETSRRIDHGSDKGSVDKLSMPESS
jgi:hypothetical protein